MSHRRQPKMRSRSGSTIFPSSFTPRSFSVSRKELTAEEFIVSWARELGADQPFRIVVHLPEAQAWIPEAHEIAAAITGYFGYRVRTIMLDLKELFRVGWRALAIGLIVLFLSVIIGQTAVANLAPRPIGQSHRGKFADFRMGRRTGGQSKYFCTSGGQSFVGAICTSASRQRRWS